MLLCVLFFFFFFNDTATTEIYTLSLHDALPISFYLAGNSGAMAKKDAAAFQLHIGLPAVLSVFLMALPLAVLFAAADRKSTRLNSSHSQISYAVFCLKKKKTPITLADIVCMRSN